MHKIGAKHSLKQLALAGLWLFDIEKLPDPQDDTLKKYNYIKYRIADAVAKNTFKRMLELFAILVSSFSSKD